MTELHKGSNNNTGSDNTWDKKNVRLIKGIQKGEPKDTEEVRNTTRTPSTCKNAYFHQ